MLAAPAPPPPPVPYPTAMAVRAAEVATSALAKPRIRQSRIPFSRARQNQMRAYSVRHYGLHRSLLRNPRVIVEHVTVTSTLGPVINTFSSNAPDSELGERPGTCSHFVIDRDGTIHQLVSLRLMCRHTVGLNHTAIGIEHVGMRDGDVMGNRRQLRASIDLTRWLMERYRIARKNVIGHAESLGSPYHRERVARLRTQTHGDMNSTSMRRYRRLLVP